MNKKKSELGKDFKKLVFANCINRFGDSIDAIALTWLVYAITGSAFWSALYYACNQLPSVLIQPFAGAIVEKHSKRNTMILTDVLRGIAVGLLAIMYGCGIMHPCITIIFTLFVSSVEAFRVPAGNAFVTLVVSDEQYENAISKNTSFSTVSSLIGTAAAGTIIALLGTTAAIITDAITFFLSAALISLTATGESHDSNEEKNSMQERIKEYGELFVDGIRYAKTSTVVTGLIIMVVLFNGLLAPVNTLLAPLVSGYYGFGSAIFSAFSIALSVGMTIAGFTFVPVAEKIKSPKRMMSICAILLGMVYFMMIFIKTINIDQFIMQVAIVLLGGMVGYIVTANTTMLTVDFMRKVAKTHIARIAALYNAIASSSIPVMAFLIGIVGEFASVPVLFIAFSFFCIIIGLFMMVTGKQNNAVSSVSQE